MQFARTEEKPVLNRIFLVPRYAHLEHKGGEADMPIVETLGPISRSTRAAPRPRTAPPRFPILPMPSLEWNAEVERGTAHLYERVKNVVPSVEWPFFAPYVHAINRLKKERNAVI